MSQELHGVRVQSPLDQPVEVLPGGHALGQQAARLLAQSGRAETSAALLPVTLSVAFAGSPWSIAEWPIV